MNSLSIEIAQSIEGEDLALIRIDGRDFIEIVKEVELPLATSTGEAPLAGAYEYLPIHIVRYPSLLLAGGGVAGILSTEAQKRSLLECPCGEPGFWPLLARISAHADYVEWSDFEQPNRTTWVYPASFKFRFSRSQLEQAIRL